MNNDDDESYLIILEGALKNQQEDISYQNAIDKSVFQGDREEYFWKVVIAGDGAVGKSSLRDRYLGKNFTGEYLTTIGADFAVRDELFGEKKIKFQIWDLAGQPRFETVRHSYYRGARGALLVFDITNPGSFESLTKWVNELWRNNGTGPIPFVIVANKKDLADIGVDHIPPDVLNKFVGKINYFLSSNFNFKVSFISTSAKTGENVSEAFEQLAFQILTK